MSTTLAAAPPAGAVPSQNQITKVAIASIVGSVIEQFDFLVTGVIAATVWGGLFFKLPGLAAVAAAISVYGIGIIIRPVGAYIFGHIADRIGRRPAFFGYMLGAAVMVIVYSRLTDPLQLLVAGAVMGFFVNGMIGGYGALISELFPTAARATAQNVLFNIGRGVGGFGPLVVGTIAAAYSFEMAIALLAALYVLDILAMWLLIPERRGAELA